MAEPMINFVLVNDIGTLIWAVNLSSLEMHVFLAKRRASSGRRSSCSVARRSREMALASLDGRVFGGLGLAFGGRRPALEDWLPPLIELRRQDLLGVAQV